MDRGSDFVRLAGSDAGEDVTSLDDGSTSEAGSEDAPADAESEAGSCVAAAPRELTA